MQLYLTGICAESGDTNMVFAFLYSLDFLKISAASFFPLKSGILL
jgi:hypothetical protein